jgi:hypothetical protein
MYRQGERKRRRVPGGIPPPKAAFFSVVGTRADACMSSTRRRLPWLAGWLEAKIASADRSACMAPSSKSSSPCPFPVLYLRPLLLPPPHHVSQLPRMDPEAIRYGTACSRILYKAHGTRGAVWRVGRGPGAVGVVHGTARRLLATASLLRRIPSLSAVDRPGSGRI